MLSQESGPEGKPCGELQATKQPPCVVPTLASRLLMWGVACAAAVQALSSQLQAAMQPAAVCSCCQLLRIVAPERTAKANQCSTELPVAEHAGRCSCRRHAAGAGC